MSKPHQSHGAHHEDHDPIGGHITPLRTLLFVLITLLALTALTVYTAKEWHLGILGNAALAIGIATVKCTIVCMYFMHLKHDNPLFTVALTTCLAGVVIFLFFSMLDLGTRAFIEPQRAQLVTPIPQDMVNKARFSEEQLAGRVLFVASCASCHAADGAGGTGLTGDFKLAESKLVATLDDAALVEFIKKGRTASDPANISGFSMPPKGGNPTLTDEQLLQISQYVRALAGGDHSGDHGHAEDAHAEPAPAGAGHETPAH